MSPTESYKLNRDLGIMGSALFYLFLFVYFVMFGVFLPILILLNDYRCILPVFPL